MATDYARQFERDLPLSGPEFWRKLRREGFEHFTRQGFPSRRLEEWRYFGVQDIAASDFQLGRDKELCGFTLEEMHRLAFCILPGIRLVFLNGHFHPTLSDLAKLPPGVKIKSLSQALQEDGAALETHLSRHVSMEQHPFVALNTAFLQDGAFLQLEAGTILEKPIQLLFVSHGNGMPVISHPRVLVIAGRDSQAALIETYVGEGSYFTNAVTEIVAGPAAVLEHTKLQGESDAGFHLASTGVLQMRDSRYVSHSISLGARLCRNDLSTVLNEAGAGTTFNGLYLVSGDQVVDNHTYIDHAQPHCSSAELYKGILGGRAQGVFNGHIMVRPDAQKTASSQANKNLILSEDALVNTKPVLEIYANDVKCSHGATIGRLDDTQVFYLRSRGIDARLARSLLTYAFASDVLASLKQEALRERLQSLIFARLMSPSREAA